MALTSNTFGQRGPELSRVGLGGEGVLRTFGREVEAEAVIREALNLGVTYFDTAAAYAGSQAYLGRVWSRDPSLRDKIFQAGKSAERTAAAALKDLDRSLAALHTTHLDLWQIHDLRTEDEFRLISGPGGALEGFLAAQKAGKVRFIGVTGHHDPVLLARAVREWPVDAVLLPVNPVEACLGGFVDETIQEAREKGLAVIGMKVLGGGRYLVPDAGLTAGLLVRYALSQPVTQVIVGCRTPAEVGELVRAGQAPPLTPSEQSELAGLFRPQARKMAFYRGW
ncbi:MAG: aldo/keto reductase [Pseudomonadota bacterium]